MRKHEKVMSVSPDLLKLLACPYCRQELSEKAHRLICPGGHEFPIVEGVPVLLRRDVSQTLNVMQRSIEAADEWKLNSSSSPFFVETLGINNDQRAKVLELDRLSEQRVDPVVSVMVAATGGFLYEHLVGELKECPVPDLRLPVSDGEILLDIGCNWGRWLFAAARKGYKPIGIDPSLGAVLAAQRQARKLDLEIDAIVADARYLPIADQVVDVVFSYSVLQHFSKEDVGQTLHEVSRILKPDGQTLIQMASAWGVRSLYHLLKRRFREPRGFEVRYWTPRELKTVFGSRIGPSMIEVDGFLGLGIQPSDLPLLTTRGRWVVKTSELVKDASRVVGPLGLLADSQYVRSRKPVALR